MSITVNTVTKVYGQQKALDNVSFSVKTGEIVGLLGPNGAGKSTLMKILTCYLPPTTGNAKVLDMDVMERSLDVRKKVGYLPENNPLYLDMYVKEFLKFVAGIHKLPESHKRISEIIEMTGLVPEVHKKIGALSKGYRQRVGLAQALIHDPEVLILDEPTSGLDPNQIIDIRNLIRESGKKKTVLLSTHIMQEVEAICNRVIIIDHGKIVADDSTDKLHELSNGRNMVEVEFDKSVSKESLLKIKGILSVRSAGVNKWEVEAESNIDARKELFQFAVKNDLTVLSLSKERFSMEEVFQRLTKSNI